MQYTKPRAIADADSAGRASLWLLAMSTITLEPQRYWTICPRHSDPRRPLLRCRLIQGRPAVRAGNRGMYPAITTTAASEAASSQGMPSPPRDRCCVAIHYDPNKTHLKTASPYINVLALKYGHSELQQRTVFSLYASDGSTR
jgi:hypothetical protein